MLRYFFLMVSVMAISMGAAAGDVAPCPGNTVPIEIMTLGIGGAKPKYAVAEISSDLPHFRAFVTAVTEHVAVRLSQDKLCIKNKIENRSELQFVHWPLLMKNKPFAARLPITGAQPSGCQISSPWIDLALEWKPVPRIRGIIRWNERQLLADQAALAGAKNVPPGVAEPLDGGELGPFMSEYEQEHTEIHYPPVAKPPIEERIPPDLLWLFRRSGMGVMPFIGRVNSAMRRLPEKGAEGYTKLVLALIDRCFASEGEVIYYTNILDAADLIPLEQYKIDRLR
jgi:hypothetical protein